jgi:hypothetical protein
MIVGPLTAQIEQVRLQLTENQSGTNELSPDRRNRSAMTTASGDAGRDGG